MTRVGIVCPLPPSPSGPADWVADSADLLGTHLELTFLVDEPEAVRPDLRSRLDVRGVEDRHDPSLDVVIYHLANNPHHEFVYRAALEGPAGLCEVHDGTMHHLVNHIHLLDGDGAAYEKAGSASHGEAGRDAANMRRAFNRGSLDLFAFDLLGHVLGRHLGAIVHSEYAARLIALEAPDLPVWLARLHAPAVGRASTKAEAGLPSDRFVIGSFGYVAAPKRPLLLLEATRRVVDAGVDAHLVFVGKDDTHGELTEAVSKAGMGDRVTVTGFADEARFEAILTAVDAAVSLRAPHAGETSATLAQALAAGRPTIVQNVGSWAELPDEVVVKAPVGDDEAEGLARSIQALAEDEPWRGQLSSAAATYAATVLSLERYCEAVVVAVEGVRSPTTRTAPGAYRAPRHLRTDRTSTIWEAVLDAVPDRLQRVLVVDCPAWFSAELSWIGHEVDHRSSGELDDASAGGYDLVVASAPRPGPDRRSELSRMNRSLDGSGRVILSIVNHTTGGDALMADLDVAGFSVRSPRFDEPPPGLWPPPRGDAATSPDHVIARKARLPRAS